jgi:tripartite-type tricarboxylate transporter receptor subunit TctC
MDSTLLARKSLPVNNFSELLALAKQKPGQLTFGSFGLATNGHLWILDLQRAADVSFNIIHYKGMSGSLTDVIADQIDLAFVNSNSARSAVQGGMAKMLAVTGEHRLEQFPDVATASETLPGYSTLAWYGLWAPAGTPSDIIAKLNNEVREMVASQEFQEKYIKPNRWRSIATAPDQFQKFIESEQAKWSAIVRTVDLRM